jgi:FHS family L-fucose permease-like MFS transporter
MALLTLSIAFFAWGFLTCLVNSILMPILKTLFYLSYGQAALVELSFFSAYGVLSIPMANFLCRFGYQAALAYGFVLAASGCLFLLPSALTERYDIFLIGFFVLASGNVLLEVAANPLATLMGNPKMASGRLTLLQGFNSLGTAVAPLFGTITLLGLNDNRFMAIALSFSGIALGLYAMAVFTFKIPFPIVPSRYSAQEYAIADRGTVWRYPHLILGCIAIFLYVGAEVGIGSFLLDFMQLPKVTGLSAKGAATYVSYYWTGMMVGRFAGGYILRYLSAQKVLLVHALLAIGLLLLAMLSQGVLAMVAALTVGLVNSLMFPVIFSLAIRGLGKYTAIASGILCVSIIGAGILPLLQGMVADHFGLSLAFTVPLVCYVYIAYYAHFSARILV